MHRLRKMGFAALFIQNGSKDPVCILLYVDDLVITGSDLTTISKVKSQLSEAFEMKNPRDLHYFLGIKVVHTPDDILLSQRHYALNILYKFNMTHC